MSGYGRRLPYRPGRWLPQAIPPPPSGRMNNGTQAGPQALPFAAQSTQPAGRGEVPNQATPTPHGAREIFHGQRRGWRGGAVEYLGGVSSKPSMGVNLANARIKTLEEGEKNG